MLRFDIQLIIIPHIINCLWQEALNKYAKSNLWSDRDRLYFIRHRKEVIVWPPGLPE